MKIGIATVNLDKLDGIMSTILRFFNLEKNEVELYAKSVKSDVPSQPFDEQVYQGALNRVNALRKELQGMDFYISCEAGIESQSNKFGELFFNVQVVCVYETATERPLWGKSAGWQIPTDDVENIRKTDLDQYLKGQGITCIEEVLGTSNSRSAAVAQATWFALSSGKLRNN